MLIHFVFKYDHTWDYKDFCKELFGDNKYLCVCEKIDTNAHVHIQGDTDYSPGTIRNIKSVWCKKHFQYGHKRDIFRQSGGTVDEKGFQYVMKEKYPMILAMNGIDEDQLVELQSASEAHVEELKNALKRKIHELDYPDKTVEAFHRKCRMTGLNHYKQENKMFPPNFQKLVMWHMTTHPKCDEELENYLCERI